MTALADLPERMRNKIAIDGDCWAWTAAKNSKGYGSVSAGTSRSMLAHRATYEIANGPIAPGLEIDHLCENISCVNPAHLEAVTPEEHRRRIRHENLAPVYFVPKPYVPDPASQAASREFLNRLQAGLDRYKAMTPEERAQYDARLHRLHVVTGTRCNCTEQAA